MGVFDSSRRRPQAGPEPSGHRGYYATHDAFDYDDSPYDDWDDRLSGLDHALEAEERRRLRWWQRDYWLGRRKRWWAGRIALGLLALFILLVGWLAITAPLSKSLEPIAPPQITLLAADGTPIARNGAIVDEPVDVDTLPPHVVEAFLAIEDRRFYDHWGVDPRGIGRAIFTGTGGGSTITQQLAKFTFLTPERTLTRKAREALIAFWLESWLTKDEILERYLSNAYFGDNVYGLRAASMHYFYRKPENLKPNQAAMLAGLLQAPSRYAPTKHYDRAKQRMGLVVKSMVAAGYITEVEARGMAPPALDVRLKSDLPTGTYFADWALPEARKEADGGYARQTLTTTLDSRLQAIARDVTGRAPLGSAQVALVAMRPNGEVVAMIGGKDYEKSPFNRATQAKRQPGSTFKLFVYLAALRAGWDPDDRIANTAFTQGSYRPKNSRDRYSESLTLEEAFAQSSNVAAVRLFEEVGSEKVIQLARDLGVTSPLAKGDPSLALGTNTMSLLELTSAYAAVAGNAYPAEAHAFAKPERGFFENLWDGPSSFSSSTRDEMQRMLRAAINEGTGRAAMLSGPNFGKTGTTQDNRDALFVGYAGDLVVGVWIGNDDNSPLDGISGGGLPARIWRDFMNRALGVQATGQPAPREQRDPGTPIEPLDVPDIGDIPVGDGNSRIRIRDGEAVFSTEVDGIPIDIRIGEDGIGIDDQAIEEARRRAEERQIEAEERYEEIRRQRDERLRDLESARF
ncbi:transglycosylase domain-containing protein [Qipengyuania sp. G39]|uniref:peptidoglycan glycosyltransferase n=1 Tax=Qipengyuania profundimaris TaxID=3067652 RepID=A0ABT9HNL5_9SPHN|nr:transglycosylase domain-containing protein [Qipengyuania sp. G39]MDP4574737.1 transglycosylase domain-containing protein [Qipengyuania sp. G39]